jgi:hypothetical protein
MFLRLAGPIHEAVFPPDGSARAIGRRRHVPAGASHDGSRLGVVREAAPAASPASWACERPDAQANRDRRKNECSPCDHTVNPATYAMVDASTWSRSNLNRAEIAACGLSQCVKSPQTQPRTAPPKALRVPKNEQDADARLRRLMTARRITDTATLVASLRDPDNRSFAAMYLSELGATEAAPEIVRLLEANDPLVRSRAARARSGCSAHLRRFLGCWNSPPMTLRRTCVATP